MVGVALSIVVFFIVQGQEQARVREQFDQQASTYAAAIQKGIDRSLEVVDSIGGLHATSREVSRRDFREFVKGSPFAP